MHLIEKKIQNLPPDLQNEVIDFIDYLTTKKMKNQKGKRPFGLCNGQIKIAVFSALNFNKICRTPTEQHLKKNSK